jgi:hypothetical protein
VQKYGNDPAVMNVVLYFSPGGIEPELHTPVVDVAVCVRVSLLVHVTVPPTDTVIGFGEYALVVNVVAPMTIDACAPVAGGVAGEAGDDEDEPPQATVNPNSSAPNAIRNLMRDLLVDARSPSQTDCPGRLLEIPSKSPQEVGERRVTKS